MNKLNSQKGAYDRIDEEISSQETESVLIPGSDDKKLTSGIFFFSSTN